MNSISARSFLLPANVWAMSAKRIFGAMVLVAAASACHESPVEATNSDVKVALTVSTNAFRPSEGTIVRVTITNDSRDVIALAPKECQTPFEVVRNNQTIVESRLNFCLAVYGPQIIQPGQSVTNQVTWTGANWNSAAVLSSGQYALRGKVFIGEKAVLGAPVSVEILPN